MKVERKRVIVLQKRIENRPAYLLAKHALGIIDFFVWIEDNPYFIEQALLYDVLIAFYY